MNYMHEKAVEGHLDQPGILIFERQSEEETKRAQERLKEQEEEQKRIEEEARQKSQSQSN